jgi:hypothetical protein
VRIACCLRRQRVVSSMYGKNTNGLKQCGSICGAHLLVLYPPVVKLHPNYSHSL